MSRPRYFDHRDALALLTLGSPWIILLVRAIWSQQVIAIRDGSHYYWPLYDWLAERQRSGEWPLWNPLENAGVSLAADPTAALWYPLKLLLWLPLPGATAYNLYLVVHVLLGLWGVVSWLRSSRSSPANGLVPDSRGGLSRGATYLAAIAYVYGGPFLFQYSNVIYLVGAAWLPWACRAIEQLVESRRLLPILQLAVILALITLGGDPQMSYHVGLLALLRVGIRPRDQAGGDSRWSFWQPVSRLALAGIIGGALAAIQILPTWTTIQRSGRATSSTSSLSTSTATQDLATQTHELARYEFSVGPWQWSEMLWPNVGGRLFPVNQRWWSTLPADGRVWCPTLFMGVIPASLALSVLTIRTKAVRVRWLSLMLLGAMWAASGWFGVGWIWSEITSACGWSSAGTSLPSEWGGLYWLMVKLLPGYGSFRYPGKWLIVVNLALAILAGHAWESVWCQATTDQTGRISTPSCYIRRWRQTLGILLGLTLVVLAISLFAVASGWWQHWHQQTLADPWLGPLNVTGSAWDLICAGIQASVVCVVAWWFSRWLGNSGSRFRTPQHGTHPLANPLQSIRSQAWCLIVLITWGDLIWANAWLVQTLPANPHHPVPTVAESHGRGQWLQETAAKSANQAQRVWRGDWAGWLPHSWAESSASTRLRQTQTWEQQTLFPKSNLIVQRGVMSREESFQSGDWLEFWDQAASRGWLRPDGGREPSPDILSLFGIDEVILPAGSKIVAPLDLSTAVLRPLATNTEIPDVDRWQLLSPMPRAWLVSQLVRIPASDSSHEEDCREQTMDVLKAIGSPRDWARLAVVESPDSANLRSFMNLSSTSRPPNRGDDSNSARARGTVRILRESSNSIELEVESPCPALCVLADRYDADWQVWITSAIDQGEINASENLRDNSPEKLLRTNRLLRGVLVPSGKSIVVFRYRPQRLIYGAIISLSAISVIALLLIWARKRENSEQAIT